MLTGTVLINELVDELNELKLSTMAATLDDLYHKPGFLEMDRLTLIAELIGPQFQEKVSTTLKNRLTAAHLKGSPEELSDCVDSDKREYLPAGITEVLSSFDFKRLQSLYSRRIRCRKVLPCKSYRHKGLQPI